MIRLLIIAVVAIAAISAPYMVAEAAAPACVNGQCRLPVVAKATEKAAVAVRSHSRSRSRVVVFDGSVLSRARARVHHVASAARCGLFRCR